MSTGSCQGPLLRVICALAGCHLATHHPLVARHTPCALVAQFAESLRQKKRLATIRRICLSRPCSVKLGMTRAKEPLALSTIYSIPKGTVTAGEVQGERKAARFCAATTTKFARTQSPPCKAKLFLKMGPKGAGFSGLPKRKQPMFPHAMRNPLSLVSW